MTKYIPATNTRSSRIKAECERGSLTLPYDSSLSSGEAHRDVCDQLCAKFDAEDGKKFGTQSHGWSSPKASGQIPDGRYVFCFIPERTAQRKTGLEQAARAFLNQQSVSNRAALRAAL